MIRTLLVVTLVIISSHLSADNNKGIDPETGLKLDSGWQLLKTNCTTCHSAKIITTQQNTRKGWIKTLRWMQNKQGLKQFDKQTEKKMIDYLTVNYSLANLVRRANLPANALPNNPWEKDKKYKVIILRKKLF